MRRIHALAFDRKKQVDMTSMVDIVFLLLIFFMVTASFTLQLAIEQPPVDTDSPFGVHFEHNDSTHVEILIDQHNTFQLSSFIPGIGYSEYVEAPSDQEMRIRLRDLLKQAKFETLFITAHGQATNDKVVTAWDAALDNGISDIRVRLSLTKFEN